MGSFDIRRVKEFRGIQGHYLAWLGVALIVVFCGRQNASAGSASAPLGVSVTVIRNCTVITSSIDVGGLDLAPTQATKDLHARMSLTATCVEGSGPLLSMELGNELMKSVTTVSTSNGMIRQNYSTRENELFTVTSHQPTEKFSTRHVLEAEKTMSFAFSYLHSASQTLGAKYNGDFFVVTIDF